MDRKFKMGSRADKKFQKRDLEWTRASNYIWDLISVGHPRQLPTYLSGAKEQFIDQQC